jgi:hypothetical protein
MKRRISLLATAASLVVVLAVASPAAAHNRGLVWLPTGECVQVGSLKSVYPGPDKSTQLDLRPETIPADEIGTAYAADEGNSKLEKGDCPI